MEFWRKQRWRDREEGKTGLLLFLFQRRQDRKMEWYSSVVYINRKGNEKSFGYWSETELGGTEIERSRLVWTSMMEVRDSLRGMHKFRSWQPRCFLVSPFISGPLNQIQEFAGVAFVDLGVEHFRDFVLKVSVNLFRRRQREYSIRNCVWSDRFQHGNVEDGMCHNPTHLVRGHPMHPHTRRTLPT